jgi:MraZ protein
VDLLQKFPQAAAPSICMALTGTYDRSLDDKQRLAIPRPLKDGFRDGDSEELYLAPGNEGCLALYSLQGFEAFASRMAALSTGRVEVRNFLRLFYGQAERVQVDKQSRIRIPERLLKLAGLTHEVVLIGVQDHVEIWDRGRWDSFLNQNGAQFDALTAEAFNLPPGG